MEKRGGMNGWIGLVTWLLTGAVAYGSLQYQVFASTKKLEQIEMMPSQIVRVEQEVKDLCETLADFKADVRARQADVARKVDSIHALILSLHGMKTGEPFHE